MGQELSKSPDGQEPARGSTRDVLDHLFRNYPFHLYLTDADPNYQHGPAPGVGMPWRRIDTPANSSGSTYANSTGSTYSSSETMPVNYKLQSKSTDEEPRRPVLIYYRDVAEPGDPDMANADEQELTNTKKPRIMESHFPQEQPLALSLNEPIPGPSHDEALQQVRLKNSSKPKAKPIKRKTKKSYKSAVMTQTVHEQCIVGPSLYVQSKTSSANFTPGTNPVNMRAMPQEQPLSYDPTNLNVNQLQVPQDPNTQLASGTEQEHQHDTPEALGRYHSAQEIILSAPHEQMENLESDPESDFY